MTVRSGGVFCTESWDAFIGLVAVIYTLTAAILGYSAIVMVMSP